MGLSTGLFGLFGLDDLDPADLAQAFAAGGGSMDNLPPSIVELLTRSTMGGPPQAQPFGAPPAAGPRGPNPDMARLFNPEPLGPAQGFARPDDLSALAFTAHPQPGAMAGAMTDAPLPPPRPLSFGPLPAPTAADAPKPAMPVGLPAPRSMQPLGGLPPASDAAAEAAQAAQGVPQAPGTASGGAVGPTSASTPPAAQRGALPDAAPSMWDRFLNGLGQNSDFLMNFGAGVMSTPGWGAGIAAGIKGASQADERRASTDLARQAFGLKVADFQQKQVGRNQTIDSLTRRGHSRVDAEAAVGAAAAGNATMLNNMLNNAMPKLPDAPAGYSFNTDRSALTYTPGGPHDPKILEANAKAVATDKELTLLDTPELRTKYGVHPNDPRTARVDPNNKVVFDAVPVPPRITPMEGNDGSKRYGYVDPITQRPIEVALPPGSSGGGNPYATGKFNENQGKAAGFADRMMGSEGTLRQFESINGNALQGAIAGSSMFPNTMKSEDRQQFEQAKRNFINAQLRRESGASIQPPEFDSAERQYFPIPGDGSKVIEQKRINRRDAISAMGREAGQAYVPSYVFGDDGGIAPNPGAAKRGAAQPSRDDLMAEARKRGLVR